jgi:NitT/TauT family transport system permease protein
MIFGSLVGLLRSGELFRHLAVSMVRIGVGFLMGAVPGILLGVAMGLSRYVRAAIKPLIGAVYPVPKIAVLPLIMLIFGLGEMSKYVVIAISVFFLILVNTMAGVMNIDKVYLEVGRSFHASRIDAFRTIAIPGALPLIFSGIRLAWGVSLLVIVAAEFVGAKSGLGYFTWQAWLTFQIEEMYVGLIVISFLGWASFMILDELERHLLPWKP